MRIVPSYNLGVLGPAEGPATLYAWRWHYSVPSLGLWVVLVIAMVLPQANRRPGALLIVAPVVVVYGGWLALLKWVLPSQMFRDDSFDMFLLAPALGSALLWLLGHLLARGTWRRTLVGALAIVTGTTILTTLAFRLEISAYSLSMMGGLSIPMLAMVVGYAMAGRRCRASWRRIKFAFSWVLWTLIPAVAGGVTFLILQCALTGAWPGNVGILLGFGALGGLILGVMALLIALPFLLVGLRVSMFHERLWSCLRLPSGAVAPQDNANMQREAAIGESNPLPTP